MKIFTCLIATLAVGFCYSHNGPGYIDESNLVKNNSAESLEGDAPSEWVQRTWSGQPVFEVESAFGKTGKRSFKIHSDSGADASWSFVLKVKPDTEYRLSAWIKTEKLGADGYGAQLNLHELQKEGKTNAVRGTQDWTQVSSEFNSGSHDTLLLNLLFGGWGRATGTAWFDDVTVIEIKKEVQALPKMSDEEAADFFVKRVLPVFKKHCFECHGAGDKIKGGFVITHRDDLLEGGPSGPAIDEDEPLESLLIDVINYGEYEMPPSGKLPQEDIDAITTWVQLGSPWKGDGHKPKAHPKEEASVPQVNAETRKFWSFLRPKKIAPPESMNPWASNPIDEFVLAKLNQAGFKPNPQASKQTLIRRAYYDLTGLPPTPEAVAAFVSDDDPQAYAKLVDHLLESKHYGEKWGRHWLDLVRYAESNSYERDGTKPFVWRYRDYVIRAFNDDKPYDQFVIEQLAGDELPGNEPDHLIATGFYRLGKWDDEPVDHEQAWFDDADDILATTSKAFIGMTIDCARCHDHKIDPVPQADYYSLLSFFRNIHRYGVRGHDTVLRQSTRTIAPFEDQEKHQAEVKAYEKQVADNHAALRKIEERVKVDFIPVEHEEFKHEMNRVPLVKKRIGKKLGEADFTQSEADGYAELFDEMKRLRREKPKSLEAALCVTEKGSKAPDTHILIRGNSKARGEKVEPAFPSVLSPPAPNIQAPKDGKSTGRRLALARWIASPQNPLTARVMVNRIWQNHFGRGIVRSASDFGFQGTKPTHPELLDWLANEFVAKKWSIKQMHRLMMNSSTYKMSADSQPDALAKDPTNDLFWRFNMRRLTAEEVRDSILSVNETLLTDKMFGPSIYTTLPQEVLDGQSRPGENWHTSPANEQARRSIYIHIKRTLPVPLLASFDVADTDSSCPVRFNTVQPTQALAMLNSQFVNEQAAKFASQVISHEPDHLEKQIGHILKKVLQREPNRAETQRGVDYVTRLCQSGTKNTKALQQFCVVALNLNEFLYLD